jgi:hypothetical protein
MSLHRSNKSKRWSSWLVGWLIVLVMNASLFLARRALHITQDQVAYLSPVSKFVTKIMPGLSPVSNRKGLLGLLRFKYWLAFGAWLVFELCGMFGEDWSSNESFMDKALIPCDKLKENKMMKKELLHEGLGNLLVFFLKWIMMFNIIYTQLI